MYSNLPTRKSNLAAAVADRVYSFKHLHHLPIFGTKQAKSRMLVGEYRGVQWIDDSASPSTRHTWFSLQETVGRVVWIVDGYATQGDLDILVPEMHRVSAIIALGKNEGVEKKFAKIVPILFTVESIAEAVIVAQRLAREGDVVLYSPVSYEELEGDAFESAVFDYHK